MIVTLTEGADVAAVRRALVAEGLWLEELVGARGTQFEVLPGSREAAPDALRRIHGVADVLAPKRAHPRVDAQGPRVDVGGLAIGGETPVLIAGPCSVESEAQIEAVAARVAAAGARVLRGGAFKPRSSPYSFQGHGELALAWLSAAARRHGLAVVTEVMAPEQARVVAEHADALQVGSRNMQNFALLRAVAAQGRPIVLKRGMAASVEEWLLAGEYCLLHGAPGVVFCERGVRGFDPAMRNLLDLGAVALLAGVHHLPVLVDPSHALGRRDLVPALSRAALAAGATGLMIETHDDPGSALSDGPQALPPLEFAALARSLGFGGAA